jgi:uncharacterized protein with GYD domain
MPQFLVRFSYTPETWARLIQAPEDRRGPVEELVESIGGRMLGFWYAFGEYDGYVLIEAPDNISHASVSVTAASSGTLTKSEAIVLLTEEEMLEALKRAQGLEFRAPGRGGAAK